jgi:ectoine hydroxylase-related dioxygenase (phytanoyl-CoA dioxygenase family)
MARVADLLAGHGGRSRAGVRGLMADPAIASIAADPRLLALAALVLGGSAHPFRATLFEKSAMSNWLVSWHQDTALPLRARSDAPGWSAWSMKAGVLHAHAPAEALRRIVALRVHLDDSRADNGPLRVLPGSHAHGVLDESGVRELAERVPPHECTIDAGGVLAMSALLVHASSKARSDAPRRVLHVEYASTLVVGPGLELAVT